MYLSFNSPFRNPGVYKKEINLNRAFLGEAKKRNWYFKGVNVVVDYPKQGPSLQDSCYKVISISYPLQFFAKYVKGLRMLVPLLLYRRAACQQISRHNPDILICRYSSLPFHPKKIFKNIFFITNHQTKEGCEWSVSWFSRLVKKPIEQYSFKRMFRDLDAINAVTSEIAKYEIGRGGASKPYFVLSNCVIVEDCRIKKYYPFHNRLDCLFMAAHNPLWHGLDRLVKGIAKYRGKINVFLHIIGDAGNGTKRLIRELGLQDRVIFHGFKFGSELDELFDVAHIAVGPLAVHRKSQEYCSSIKVPEYLARGIPCVIAHKAEDIRDDFPFVLRLPANDEPIDVLKIIDFTERIHSSFGEKMTAEIRSYAALNMDYRHKVKDLFDFIYKLKNKSNEINEKG